jgi:hypothetical protein
VLAVSLVPPAEPAAHDAPSAVVTEAPMPLVVVDSSALPPATAASLLEGIPAPALAASASTTALPAPEARAAAGEGAPRLTAQAEHFFRASELSRLPGLNGEPLIDLGDAAQALSGDMSLRLFIDETGRVVDHRIEGSQGLPDAVVDKLKRAFAGYPYVPGQRQGQAVKCQVTLAIGVRDGRAAMGAPQ